MTFTGDKLKQMEASITDMVAKHTELDTKYQLLVETEKHLTAKVATLETEKADFEAKLKALEANPQMVTDLQAKVTALETEKTETSVKLEAAVAVSAQLEEYKKNFDAKVKEEAARLSAEIIASQRVPEPVNVSVKAETNNNNKPYISGGLKIWSPFDKQ
jgi:chromosome segregation ATPase